jgi:hypothetical protein
LTRCSRPPQRACCETKYGHDAVHVTETDLRRAPDTQVAATARSEGRAVVTENVADLSAERDVVLVFVLKKHLSVGGGQAAALATVLDSWHGRIPIPISDRTGPAPTNQNVRRQARAPAAPTQMGLVAVCK